MAEEKQTIKKDLVYSKNFYLSINNVYLGGKPVSKELDKELDEKLGNGKKASDYHITKAEYDKNMELSKLKIGIKVKKKK
jgi:hypothetical protein